MDDPVGLVFDLDGTLIDSAPDIHATANTVFAAEGLAPFDMATVRGFIGNGVGVLVARLLAFQGLPDSGALHLKLVAGFIKCYEEAVGLTTLYPGVPEALDRLSAAGHLMAICTNKPFSPALSVLRHLGLDRHFPTIIGGDSLAERKPHPAPLLAARSLLGVSRILFVGDSEVDAACAVSAAVPFILYTEGYRKIAPEDFDTKYCFNDLENLSGVIRAVTEG